MYQFFLCKANIIDWKVKPKSILFAPFFQENVRNCVMAAKGLLSILSQYKSYTVLIGFRHKPLPLPETTNHSFPNKKLSL